MNPQFQPPEPDLPEDRPWWQRQLDLVDEWDEDAYEGRYVSQVGDLLGVNGRSARDFGDNMHGKLNKTATEIARLMNTVLNSAGGEARRNALHRVERRADEGDRTGPTTTKSR